MARYYPFVFTGGIPKTITAAGIRYSFNVRRQGEFWTLTMTKHATPPASVNFGLSRYSSAHLTAQLVRDGFEVDSGSQAERAAQWLAAHGYVRRIVRSRKG